MDEPKTVYLVTTGSYSDYDVVAVFDDKELADEFRQRFNYLGNDLEEYALNPAVQELRAGKVVWEVDIAHDGTVARVARSSSRWIGSMEAHILGYDHDANEWAWWWKDTKSYGCLNVQCWARDEEHAIKIANEQRAIWLANGKWPELPSD